MKCKVVNEVKGALVRVQNNNMFMKENYGQELQVIQTMFGSNMFQEEISFFTVSSQGAVYCNCNILQHHPYIEGDMEGM